MLAEEQKIRGQPGIEEHDGFSAQDAVFGAAKREHIHARVAGDGAQGQSEAGGGVGNARPVHVQIHSALVGKMGQGFNFFGPVDRAHLGGLRNGNHSGLHVMLVADAVIGMANGIERDLSVLMGQRNQFAAGESFGSPALVGIDVREVAAQDRVVGASERLQAQHVRSRAVKGEKYLDAGAEMLLQLCLRRGGVRIGAVAYHVPVVHLRDGCQNFRVDSGVVVAGKAAGGVRDGGFFG